MKAKFFTTALATVALAATANNIAQAAPIFESTKLSQKKISNSLLIRGLLEVRDTQRALIAFNDRRSEANDQLNFWLNNDGDTAVRAALASSINNYSREIQTGSVVLKQKDTTVSLVDRVENFDTILPIVVVLKETINTQDKIIDAQRDLNISQDELNSYGNNAGTIRPTLLSGIITAKKYEIQDFKSKVADLNPKLYAMLPNPVSEKQIVSFNKNKQQTVSPK